MTRDELLSSLEQARRIEEALGVYAQHLYHTLYLSGLKKELRDKVKETLNGMGRDSRESSLLINRLMEEIRKGR